MSVNAITSLVVDHSRSCHHYLHYQRWLKYKVISGADEPFVLSISYRYVFYIDFRNIWYLTWFTNHSYVTMLFHFFPWIFLAGIDSQFHQPVVHNLWTTTRSNSRFATIAFFSTVCNKHRYYSKISLRVFIVYPYVSTPLLCIGPKTRPGMNCNHRFQ